MRRIALAGGLAALALAGTAGYAVTATTWHATAQAEDAGLSTALDAEAHGNAAAASGADTLTNTGSAGAIAGSTASSAGTTSGDSTAATGSTPAAPATPKAPTPAGTPTPSTGCDENGWELRVQGLPAHFDGGDRAGDYLGHDANGFHLRVTHRGDRKDVFAGYIRSDAAMALRPARLEGRDAVWLSADRKTLGFRFYDYGHVDGVDFVTHCASRLTVFGLTADGHALPANRVYLGHFNTHPANVPFTIDRRHSA
jgi:hypothetical protein